METSHNTSTSGNTSRINARVRSGLILLGIVTSIICSMILLKDVHSAERAEAGLPTLQGASEIMPTKLVVGVGKIRIASILSLGN